MKIIEVTENKKEYLDLLLLADEQENMVDCYLDNGRMYICPCQVRNKKKLFFQKYWGTFSKIPQYYFFSI